ncbi:type II CAAX endopeptidase family protein [Natronoglomus mannanivorans]|uniref:CPBP family intramembrane metalloprotease n=1 Tax=Natronoglomus mannanivorans TaxID=2979990 RepID=A0AAP3E437_9EURY|nr:CPBP family intramembrane metalloprotease [Halobacteria archaeon AArc-xg1-1]
MILDNRADVQPTILLAIGIALVGLPAGGILMDSFWDSSIPPAVSSIYNWILVGGLVGFVLFVENKPLASIGLSRPDRRDVLVGVGLFVLGMISLILAAQIVGRLGIGTGPVENGSGETSGLWPLLAVLFVGITAGITEEIVYRGYALERIEGVANSTWVAGIVTATVFVLIHFGTHGIAGMLIISPVAVLLTVAYVWRRNLFVPILAHVLVNSFWDLIEFVAIVLGSV